MAFPAAAGYGNLSQGNFSPVLYSKNAQLEFRRKSVVQAITNSDYFGEIANQGDSVRIIREPMVTVRPLTRGQQITAQELDDDDFTLTVDQANYFAFKVDDIEEKHSHVNWKTLASNQAAYRLVDTFDSAVLTYMTTQLSAANTLGGSSTPHAVTFASGVSTGFTPVGLLNRAQRLLDVANVPKEGRWFVGDPVFWEMMGDEASKLVGVDFTGAKSSLLRNGQTFEGKIRNFTCYESNNLPVVGTGPTTTTSSANYGWLLAGHISSTATAEQIRKTESYRDPDSFADVVRGMHLYGRKTLRAESLVGIRYNLRAS